MKKLIAFIISFLNFLFKRKEAAIIEETKPNTISIRSPSLGVISKGAINKVRRKNNRRNTVCRFSQYVFLKNNSYSVIKHF